MNVLAFSYSFPSQLKIALHFIMIKLVVCAMQSFSIGFEVINPSKSDSFLIRMSFFINCMLCAITQPLFGQNDNKSWFYLHKLHYFLWNNSS